MLVLQDPTHPNSLLLHEVIARETRQANQGAAAFAWATTGGIDLLLEDPDLQHFFRNNNFLLVVGISAITTPKALKSLLDASKRFPRLSVKIYHSQVEELFHPKFLWLRNQSGGTLIIGSGNLTLGGLRDNSEAFAVQNLDSKDFKSIQDEWEAWLARHSSDLIAPSDPRAVTRAKKNTGWMKGGRRRRPEQAGVEVSIPPTEGNVHNVLLAAIPEAGSRWSQANFKRAIYEGYFGARVGSHRRMVFQHVASSGSLGVLEIRPSVQVRSHNWRFELDAARGKKYPTTGRPIAVFLRTRPRGFLYRLLLPSDPDYKETFSLLQKMWKGPSNQVPQVVMDFKDASRLPVLKQLAARAQTTLAEE